MAADNIYSGTLEASKEAVEEWLLSSGFEAQLFSFFPCTNILPTIANKVRAFLELPPDSKNAIVRATEISSSPASTIDVSGSCRYYRYIPSKTPNGWIACLVLGYLYGTLM